MHTIAKRYEQICLTFCDISSQAMLFKLLPFYIQIKHTLSFSRLMSKVSALVYSLGLAELVGKHNRLEVHLIIATVKGVLSASK